MTSSERAERFKKARTEKNIHGSQSRDQVCNDTGIAVSLLEDLENYKKDRQVAYQKIAILAKHYGVSADYLLGISPCPLIDDKAKAACEYTHLSANAVKSLNTCFDPGDSFFPEGVIDGVVDLANSLVESDTLLRILLSVQRIRDISNEIQSFEKKAAKEYSSEELLKVFPDLPDVPELISDIKRRFPELALIRESKKVSKLGERLVIEKVCATECLDAFIDKYSSYSLSRDIVHNLLSIAFDGITEMTADRIENESASESEDE